MDIDGRTVNLALGMAVTVEIKTGTRKVISYVISPLIRNRQESLRERDTAPANLPANLVLRGCTRR